MKTHSSVQLITLGFLIALLCACETRVTDGVKNIPTQNNTTSTEREARDYLTKTVAENRARRVTDVRYELFLNLPQTNQPFSGKAAIHFTLRDADAPLTLDFVGGDVQSIVINEKSVQPNYNGFFITLPTDVLQPGPQHVVVEYTHPYRRDGRGLHWFQDPEDGETYLYTQFEAWDFNKVFPGFDQPDLKATYQLQVEVPEHWQVITSVRESNVESIADRKLWQFPATEKFSTYLLSLHAGPYKVWEDPNQFRIPMRLLARASYAENVEVEHWFKITRQGFDYFESYFEFPFPFSKYDQLLVPEFVFGGMENVGAVTFREGFQPYGRVQTDVEKRGFTVVVMHEMAHQWFGNLVTMGWWDDLWLNESFADLMGWQATAAATEHKDAMQAFSFVRKPSGYSEDRWITTHPISQYIGDTDTAMNSIDGITYAKGASSLIQLKHLIGDEAFRKGLVNYFNKHAWGNTELSNFMAALANTADRDLQGWTQQWLMNAGVNTLIADFSCELGKITSFGIEQTPANMSTVLREHRLDVLFVDDQGRRQTVNVDLPPQRETNINLPDNMPCPEFILPNVSDYTFAGIRLDPKSRAYLQEHFLTFDNPVERGMIWRSLWESVIDGDVAATEVLDLALTYLPHERDASSLNTQLSNVMAAYFYVAIRPHVENQSKDSADYYQASLENLGREQYQNNNGSLQKAWFGLWQRVLQSEQSINLALELIESDALDNDERWELVAALVRQNVPAGQERAKKLAAQDNSASTQLYYLIAQALAPNIEIKRQWIQEAKNPHREYSFTQMRSILGWMFPLQQYPLNRQLQNEIIDSIPQLMHSISSPMLTTYVSALVSLQCSSQGEQQMLQLAQLPDLSEQVVKVLKKQAQSEARCVKALKQLE